jgi:voltage-gated potassium channel Kch
MLTAMFKRRRELVLRASLTPIGAARAIAATTLVVTIVSGVLIHIVDSSEYPTLGRGWWWAAETVTTVGYGDVVPKATAGRIVAVFVMLSGLAFLTVATAAISARLIESRRRSDELEAIAERLDRLEALLRDRRAA